MGSLKPGATYIYEHADGVTYAREFGATTRVEIGRTYSRHVKDDIAMWQKIVEASVDNPALQSALEYAKIIYHLGTKDGNSKES